MDFSALTREAIGPWQDPDSGNRKVLQGPELLPWCPTRLLTDEEADHLLHGRPVPLGDLLAPAWPLPEGFPDPAGPVAGLHQGLVVALLREKEGAYWTSANLRGGI